MRIEKINTNSNQILEKTSVPADSVIFVLYDPRHKPVIQVFKNVNEVQTHERQAVVPGAA